ETVDTENPDFADRLPVDSFAAWLGGDTRKAMSRYGDAPRPQDFRRNGATRKGKSGRYRRRRCERFSTPCKTRINPSPPCASPQMPARHYLTLMVARAVSMKNNAPFR